MNNVQNYDSYTNWIDFVHTFNISGLFISLLGNT
jgi:hypothetical protein